MLGGYSKNANERFKDVLYQGHQAQFVIAAITRVKE
jgi:hypothetical protein